MPSRVVQHRRAVDKKAYATNVGQGRQSYHAPVARTVFGKGEPRS
ncbi:hypothetical protein [Candidatus Vallotia cooleyia]|nr:hypothetical protein [Candidatus Vallotia cooleyia]